MTVQDLSALAGALRNPDDPAHLMVIKGVPRRIRIYAGATLIADSHKALRVLEIGKSFHDPVVYVPECDLTTRLDALERTTFCPIKGEASYVTHKGEEIGWVYRAPIPMAEQLTAHHAFWPDKVRLVEGE